jgi:tetratricopeptide (TPR) repeat protein
LLSRRCDDWLSRPAFARAGDAATLARMRQCRRLALYSAIVATAMLASASGQARAQSQSPGWVEPPAAALRASTTRDIDFLFGALKAAPDDTSAKAIEDRIWAQWLASGSDTVNLLMMRVKTAVDKEDFDLAVRLLDAIIEIRPGYAEAWNRRATVFYLKKDFSNALADLRQVLRREPRHFAALAGLGTIMQEVGDDKSALAAYRAALALHPRLKGMADKVRSLTETVEGRPI